MEKSFYIGLGVAVIFGLLPFSIKDMPSALTWGGIALGISIVAWPFIPGHPRFNGPLILGSLSVIFLTAAAGWWISIPGVAFSPDIAATDQKNPPKEQKPMGSVGIKADGVKNLHIEGNIFNGQNEAMSLRNSENVTVKDNKINPDQGRGGFPPPTGEYHHLSNSDLRSQVTDFSAHIRACEKQYDAATDALFSNEVPSNQNRDKNRGNMSEGFDKIRRAKNDKFKSSLLPRAISLASELDYRLSGTEISVTPKNSSIRLGSDILINKMLVGPHPMSAIADFLEYAAAKLH